MDSVQSFYEKHKQKISYLFFGGLTTVVSIGTFVGFTRIIPLGELVANVLSWVFAVLFAFFTNRKWVFSENAEGNIGKQLTRFCMGRFTTLLLEESILLIFVTILQMHDLAVKVVAQILVVVLNFIISKLFVFKR